MLATSGGILGASLLGAPVFSQAKSENQDPMKILVTGAHPDDPESGCGGTIGRFVALGNEVAVLYLTRGEAGIEGVSHEEAAEIRTAESLEACKLMGARPLFAGQIDGKTYPAACLAQPAQLRDGTFYNPAIHAVYQAKTFCGGHKAAGQNDFAIIANHTYQHLVVLHSAVSRRHDRLVHQLEAIRLHHFTYRGRPVHGGWSFGGARRFS